ncbi:acyl-CoA dehydrogenase family protein, partial [Nocardia sp. NPDC051911]|uniref:acyl-CoA dehydrogenase family protein n=1 Tax=Nocardia sp. NPDC051911 TaxID=3154648 RepID=UPI00342DFD6B
PERIMGAAMAVGMGRYAIERAVEYAKERRSRKREPQEGREHAAPKAWPNNTAREHPAPQALEKSTQ